MHVVTHLLMGWAVAEHTTKSPRERGGAETAIWPIHYLSPLSDALTVAWSVQ